MTMPSARAAIHGNEPLVTVLIPVFNGAPWLDATLHSVRAQTWQALDILVIDDGSSDGSAGILARHAAEDGRIRVVSRENRGLVATLNEGLSMARGTYIARMDADDLYAPGCIAAQVAVMEADPALVLLGVGTWEHRGWRLLTRGIHGREMTRLSLLFFNAVGHPGVMLRRSTLDTHGLRYDPEYFLAEDHELWARLADLGAVDILPQPLVFYRRHDAALSRKHHARQLQVQRRITARQLQQWLGVPMDDCLATDNATWCGTLMRRLFASQYWHQADPAIRRLLLRLLQDFCLRHGTPAAWQYLRLCGLRGLFAGRWGGLWFLVRMTVRAARRQ